LQREVIEGRARIALQMAFVETLTANGQDAQVIVDATDRNHNTHNAASMNHATKMAMA
jgi:hypothetical protein